jgi:endonuclease/exonuclease/phosphatase family metal-dependent hydrolase
MIVIEIDRIKPDIVCLQEVIHIPQSIFMLESMGYKCITSDTERPYTELIAIRNDSGLKIKKTCSVPFTNSVMGRELLIIKLKKRIKLTKQSEKYEKTKHIVFHVAVSHLESMFQFKKQRLAQLNMVFKTLSKSENAFFLADTNLHVDQALKLPASWHDCYNELGNDDKRIKYTWDGKTNPHINSKTRKRFDRIFFKSNTLVPKTFELVGTENPQSDHYGVMCKFEVI